MQTSFGTGEEDSELRCALPTVTRCGGREDRGGNVGCGRGGGSMLEMNCRDLNALLRLQLTLLRYPRTV